MTDIVPASVFVRVQNTGRGDCAFLSLIQALLSGADGTMYAARYARWQGCMCASVAVTRHFQPACPVSALPLDQLT